MKETKIGVVGLGYVGLPLARLFSTKYKTVDEASGEAFNVAYGGREYLLDIYYDLTKALGKNIEPKFGPDRKGDIKHSNADVSKAKRLLGYNSEYDFAKGLNEAIEWYKANM